MLTPERLARLSALGVAWETEAGVAPMASRPRRTDALQRAHTVGLAPDDPLAELARVLAEPFTAAQIAEVRSAAPRVPRYRSTPLGACRCPRCVRY